MKINDEEIAHLRRELELWKTLATRDQLIYPVLKRPVLNRIGLLEQFVRMCRALVRKARSTGEEAAPARLYLLYLDLDGFKRINDTYGHKAGNCMLCEFAKIVLDAAQRPCDCAGRVGGDEFVVLLSETDEIGAATVAKKILRRTREYFAKYAVTVTIGIAKFQCEQQMSHVKPQEMFTAMEWQADIALRAAKKRGKNTIGVYGDEIMFFTDH